MEDFDQSDFDPFLVAEVFKTHFFRHNTPVVNR